MNPRRVRALLALIPVVSVLLVSVVASPVAASPSVAAPPTVSLVVDGAGPYQRGDVVRVDVRLDNPGEVSAFEVTATVASDAARIIGADSRGPRIDDQHHRDLSIADVSDFATLAGYNDDGLPLTNAAHLGTFHVLVTRAGTVEIRIGGIELADGDGTIIPSNSSVTSSSIDVNRNNGQAENQHRPAPAVSWAFTDDGSKRERRVGDIEMEWQDQRLSGDPCTSRPAERAGGCLTIADVQRQATSGTLAPPTKDASARAAKDATARAAMVFVVNSRGDERDANVGNGICATASGVCSLRAAIQESNAISGADTINFAIPGSAPYRIQLTDRLPGLWTGGTVIDGYSQSGASPNTSSRAFNADVRIEIVGSGPTAFDGIVISSGGNTVKGLSLYNLRRSIWIFRAGRTAAPNVIRGNLIGTDPSGTFSAATEFDLAHGVHIEQDSANTIIGGPLPAHRNVISGNARHGVGVWHMFSDDTVVQGNIIGLTPDGTRPLPNRKHGVDLNFGASDSLIGGSGEGEANVISANRGSAIEISHTTDTTRNRVIGNIMGADLTGESGSLGNGDAAIRIEDGATNSIIRNNVIVNSARGGLRITNVGFNGSTTGTVISENWIGISRSGVAMPNKQVAVSLDGSNTVVGPDNRIERNNGPGVTVSELNAVGNTVTRNRITNNSGLAIDLAPLGSWNIDDFGDGDSGPNTLLNSPVITGVTGSTISGRACPGCRVEFYTTGSTTTGHGPLDSWHGDVTADGNGDFLRANDSIPLGSWVTATATDTAGNTSEPSWNVKAASSNASPTVNAGNDRSVDEGSTVTLTATGSDPDGEGLRYAWDLDGDNTFEAIGRSVSYRVPLIAPATVTVTVEVVDDRGGSDRDSAILTIRDGADPLYPPVGRMSAPPTVIEGARIPLAIDGVRDPDSPSTPVSVAFDCGSGYGAWGSATATSCAPQAPGFATLGVRLRDDEGSVTTYTARVVVHANRVTNGGFESGSTTATGWTHPTTMVRSTSLAHIGAASLATTTATTATAHQTFDVPSTRLLTSSWVNITGSGSVTSRVRWYDGNGSLISTTTVGSRSGDSGGWVELARTLDAPGAARRARVEFTVQTSSGARVAIDDVVLSHTSLLSQGGLDNDLNGDGQPDGWWPLSRFTWTNQQVLSGSGAGRANSDGTTFAPGQAVSRVVAGATYHASGWINVPEETTVTVRMQVRWRRSDGTAISLQEFGVHNGPTPGWIQLASSLTAPAGATQANLEIRLVGLRGEMHLDQYTLARN